MAKVLINSVNFNLREFHNRVECAKGLLMNLNEVMNEDTSKVEHRSISHGDA